MKRLYILFATFFVAILFSLQAVAFVGMTVKSNALVHSSAQKAEIVFIINAHEMQMVPAARMPGYYYLKVGDVDHISYIATAGNKVSGKMTMKKFLTINWKKFDPNTAITGCLGNPDSQRNTWVLDVTNAKYVQGEGLMFLAKPKHTNGFAEDYTATEPQTIYHATLFIDGWGGG